MNHTMLFIIIVGLFSSPAMAQEGERIAILETEVRAFRGEVDKRLERIEGHLQGSHSALGEYGPFGLLAGLWVLDKAGYYIRRKNGNQRKDQ